ncbi:hypothetical protein Tco_1548041 [Tanacetum coccineum]
MAESSSQNPSSPNLTPKEEPVTLNKPNSPNLFLPGDQVEFTFNEMLFTTNNEVAHIHSDHPNLAYFRIVSDFISKCCLRKAFISSLTQYAEYLAEFWCKGITTFRMAIGAHYSNTMLISSVTIVNHGLLK